MIDKKICYNANVQTRTLFVRLYVFSTRTYSSAMKGAEFVWDKEKPDRFIAKPDEVVPGNNMKPYGGLTSAEDRARVIVFLESPTTN
jgi:cytochrome c2